MLEQVILVEIPPIRSTIDALKASREYLTLKIEYGTVLSINYTYCTSSIHEHW